MITPRKRLLPLLTPLVGLAMVSTVLECAERGGREHGAAHRPREQREGKPVVSSFQLGARHRRKSGPARPGSRSRSWWTTPAGPGPATGVERVLVTLSFAREPGHEVRLRPPAPQSRRGTAGPGLGTLTVPPGRRSGAWSAELTVADKAFAEIVLGPEGSARPGVRPRCGGAVRRAEQERRRTCAL